MENVKSVIYDDISYNGMKMFKFYIYGCYGYGKYEDDFYIIYTYGVCKEHAKHTHLMNLIKRRNLDIPIGKFVITTERPFWYKGNK